MALYITSGYLGSLTFQHGSTGLNNLTKKVQHDSISVAQVYLIPHLSLMKVDTRQANSGIRFDILIVFP